MNIPLKVMIMELGEEPSLLSPSSSKRKAGRKKFRETRHPIYHGVRQRNGDKWVCKLHDLNQRSIWIGTFPTAKMAARAYDVAAMALKGESASLNFQDSAWTMPRARSAVIEDVRVAACEAAEVFNLEVVVDEEEVFNLPGLVDSMAEGMLLTPPAMKRGFDWDGGGDGECGESMELSLWTLDC